MARILILGGHGFIGRNLIATLDDAGFEITCADRVIHPSSFPERVETRVGNLADASFVRSLFNSAPFDWVIHLACSLIPSSTYSDFMRERDLNITGGYELMKAMLDTGSKRLLFFSTGGAIYGANDFALNPEDARLSPMNYYAYSKLAMEEFIRLESRLHGLEHVIVRPSNPYGSGQNLYGKQGLIAVSLGKVINKEKIQIWGDGSVVRDYLHISDLGSSMLALLSSTHINETYNVGSGAGYSVNQVLETIQRVTEVNLDIEYLPSRPVDVPISVLDISKIKAHAHWNPSTSLYDGISQLWNEMRHA